MKNLCALGLWLLSLVSAQATHLLGGEIQAKHIIGLTYDLTTVLYLDLLNGQAAADAQGEVTLCLGDGKQVVVKRISFETLPGSPAIGRSTYRLQYTFAAAGTYTLSSRFDKFTTNILNLPVPSQEKSMVIQTQLNTSLPNTTAMAATPRFTTGLRQNFTLTLPTTDPDGDSLAYRLVKLLSSNPDCSPALPDPSYIFPNEVTREGTFKIDRQSTTLSWNAPTRVGTYTYAYVTEEWRKGTKVAESWRTNALFVADQSASTAPVPPYEPVQFFENGLVTGLPYLDHPASAVTLRVYPVPSEEWIRVQVALRKPSALLIELLDIQGRVVQKADISTPAVHHVQELNVQNLARGTYLIRARSSEGAVTKKIVR